MMFNDDGNVHPFYVEAKDYVGFSGKPISTGIKEIQNIVKNQKSFFKMGPNLPKQLLADISKEFDH